MLFKLCIYQIIVKSVFLSCLSLDPYGSFTLTDLDSLYVWNIFLSFSLKQ